MPASLHRERILEAATAYIDRFSPDALTMRRLGVHLGVEAMALHRHVAGKEDLLAGVVDKLTDDHLEAPRISRGSELVRGVPAQRRHCHARPCARTPPCLPSDRHPTARSAMAATAAPQKPVGGALSGDPARIRFL